MKHSRFIFIVICVFLPFLRAEAQNLVPSFPKDTVIIVNPFTIKPLVPILPADTITVRVIGDVMLHKSQIQFSHKQWKGKSTVDVHHQYNFRTYLEGIREDLEQADLSIANMEFSLGGPPFTGYPSFCAPDSFAEYVYKCGVGVFLTANNHIIDRGKEGLERTLKFYAGKGYLYTGCGRDSTDYATRNPLIVQVGHFILGLVNFTYATNKHFKEPYPHVFRQGNGTEAVRAVKRARELGADVVLVFPHWGNEYEFHHSPKQEKIATKLVQAGADIIIGSHPHVVQDYGFMETDGGKQVPVYYSVGNAVSGMKTVGTQTELMVSVQIIRDRYGRISVTATHDWLWCSHPNNLSSGYMVVKENWKHPEGKYKWGRLKMKKDIKYVRDNVENNQTSAGN